MLAQIVCSEASSLGKKKLDQQFIYTMYLFQTTKTVFPSQAYIGTMLSKEEREAEKEMDIGKYNHSKNKKTIWSV